MLLNKVVEEIQNLIRARYSLIYVVSYEEALLEARIVEIGKMLGVKIFSWSVSQGFDELLVADDKNKITEKSTTIPKDCKDPIACLETILIHPFSKDKEAKEIYVLRDFHSYMEDARVKRLLRDISAQFSIGNRNIIFVSPLLNLPVELEKDVTVIDWPLPDRIILNRILEEILTYVKPALQKKFKSLQTEIVEASLGLTAVEAENIFAKALVEAEAAVTDETDPIKTILEEKKQIIRKNGFLEFYESHTTFDDDIGGLACLKNWLRKRRNSFSDEARIFGIPQPKGILLVGPSGCGKSLVAKTIGAAWKMPILRLDVGKLFGSLVGESESNIRLAQLAAESVAPCVLWVDEIEKGFAGTASSSQLDAGVTARVFGNFLTWMQEKKSQVFIVATANDVSNLPPELLRKGRFDEIFAIDLPKMGERIQIFNVHLKKIKRTPGEFSVAHLAEMTENFSGAELEQTVISALHDAFDENRDLKESDISRAIEETSPLSATMGEKIEALRSWIKGRARLANDAEAQMTETPRKRNLNLT